MTDCSTSFFSWWFKGVRCSQTPRRLDNNVKRGEEMKGGIGRCQVLKCYSSPNRKDDVQVRFKKNCGE